MKYIKPFDGLRALAVLLVIFSHWWNELEWVQYSHPGRLGVNLFFVISGFLISSILFRQRDKAETASTTQRQVLLAFYGRRALRIFPVYYLLIFWLFTLRYPLHLPLQNNETISALTYTSNFYVYTAGYWPPYTGLFWSLAVEEQFYLLWPWLLVFLPRKWTVPAIIALMGVSIGCRLLSDNYEYGYVFVYTCFDAFGLGALLAWLTIYRLPWLKKAQPWITALGMASAVFSYGIAHESFFVRHEGRLLDSFFSLGLLCFILVKQHTRNHFVSVLSWKPLAAFGRVSYGVYLFHVPLGWLAWRFWGRMMNERILLPHRWNNALIFTVDLLLLWVLCEASWHFIEKPALRWKRYFQYGNEEPKAAVQIK